MLFFSTVTIFYWFLSVGKGKGSTFHIKYNTLVNHIGLSLVMTDFNVKIKKALWLVTSQFTELLLLHTIPEDIVHCCLEWLTIKLVDLYNTFNSWVKNAMDSEWLKKLLTYKTDCASFYIQQNELLVIINILLLCSKMSCAYRFNEELLQKTLMHFKL